MYLIDFKQKEGSLTNYPSFSAILQKNPLFSMGSFCFCRYFVFRMNYRRFRTAVFFRQSVGCRVRRAVINNDDFKIGKRLRQNAVHRFVNERALVIAGITTFDSKVRGRIPNFAKRANFQRILKIVLCSICISDIYKSNGRLFYTYGGKFFYKEPQGDKSRYELSIYPVNGFNFADDRELPQDDFVRAGFGRL